MAPKTTPEHTGEKKSQNNASSSQISLKERREVIFSTNQQYMPESAAALSLSGSFLLGLSIYALWIIEPPESWSSIVLLIGLLLFGAALFFSSTKETAIAIGDAGVGLYDGQQRHSLPWYQIQSINYAWGRIYLNTKGSREKSSFLLKANQAAAVQLFTEVQSRPWCKVAVTDKVTAKLKPPKNSKGLSRRVVDTQIAGRKCSASHQVIQLEKEACFCACCSQIFLKLSVPAICPECSVPFEGNELKA